MAENQGNKGLGYLALLATSILWGTTWVVAKMGIVEMSAMQLTGMRQLIGGSLIVGFFLIFKKMRLPSRSQFSQIVLQGILLFVIANLVSTWSLKYISTGLAALIGALYPLNVVIIERVLFGKKEFNRLTIFGIILGISGIGLVFRDYLHVKDTDHFAIGLGMALVANLAWSFGTVFLARDKQELNPNYSLGWQMLFGSLVITLIGRITQPIIPLNEISAHDWTALLYLVFVGSIFAFSAFIYSMKVLPHTIASLFAYFNPLVALFVGPIIFRDEKVTPHIILGSFVTLAGVFVVNYSVRKMKADAVKADQ